MSLGASAIGEAALAEQAKSSTSAKTPRNRQAVARADIVAQPEAR